jgi:hypothetical protein
MTKKQNVTKSGDTWEWEETPETTEALKNLHKKRDYQGPLYAPHPDIKKNETTNS